MNKNLNPLLEGKYTRNLILKTAENAPELATELIANGITKKGSKLRTDIAQKLLKRMQDGSGELSKARLRVQAQQAVGDHSGSEVLKKLARGGDRSVYGNAETHADVVRDIVNHSGRNYVPGEKITETVVDDTLANKIRKWLGKQQKTHEVVIGEKPGKYVPMNPNYTFIKSGYDIPVRM